MNYTIADTSKQDSSRSGQEDRLVVATLNVHGWINSDDASGKGQGSATGSDGQSQLCSLLRQYNVDIVGLQEAPRTSIASFCQSLFGTGSTEFEHEQLEGGGNQGHFIAHHSTALLSRFPIQDATTTSAGTSSGNRSHPVRHCRGSIALPTKPRTDSKIPNLTMMAMVVHLDHMRETTRLQQLATLAQLYASHHHQDNTAVAVWMGDFNALARGDYTDAQWHHISHVRALQSWELPQTDVTSAMTGLPNSYQINSNKTKMNKKKSKDQKKHNNKQASAASLGLQLTDAFAHANASASRGMSTSPTRRGNCSSSTNKAEAGGGGPLSTCRFDTRIDYIFFDKDQLQVLGWTLESCQHVNTIQMGLSDHNMVVATFIRI